ncbi:ATP-grasp ribosomal peptide maturase [Streptomyces ipomoeae]|uniref:ATP-grasp ribosomal peptide maturase n=1 Tax=Streptomyces ipomoeae TaxID=103232 RepID=A0AAE8VV28_9ACTN|nr:ATP-grasp ribosomal peptide maturase [Streptomyces ipomoeae]MDX2826973.1 ATP-grasp ribosomal peptide maturase [Streptomyces ipomoeae]MDX2879604.1 ATP-grasp ribosomal peptide maturase [Streptomyces ipomoeae]TQE20526.1 ATP-grasp ribosomal peptide maturase [Streptomyces ipomoeae]TQE27929.1 ATP-grasp ribosomal peptide maturase [Streptomyces ipomoeae]
MAVGGPPVLVVTRLDDATADEVIIELNRRRVPVVRLDPGDFPTTVTASAVFDSIGPGGTLATETRTLDLDSVRSVYWRRPTPYTTDLAMSEQTARWAVEEARYGLGGVLAALPGAHYLNHPWRNRDAEYKPAQLATAARCGLTVPPTLITNDPDRAQAFVAEHGPVLYKPLRETDYADADGRALAVWIDDVIPDQIDDRIRHTAHLFQQRVTKTADIRLTAVGEHLFAVRIDGSTGVDWRRHYDQLTYTPITVPPELAKGVRAYLDAYGLVFGAFDFGLDPDGLWHWYECNPNGQWAWFPDHITAPITAALADQLQHGGPA